MKRTAMANHADPHAIAARRSRHRPGSMPPRARVPPPPPDRTIESAGDLPEVTDDGKSTGAFQVAEVLVEREGLEPSTPAL